jgi:RNA-splicing ligase RtcB
MGHPKKFIDETIAQLKSEGRQKEISETLKKLHESNLDSRVPKEYSYVTGTAFDDYIFDMKLIQKFAILNRLAMTEVILKGLGLTEIDRFTTVHNYIDTENMILRKGSVSAKEGERLIIPINMRDGSFICIGKGNYDWNLSAPHGAGRILGRKEAKKTLSVEKYIEEMRQIHSTSVCFDTLDESPMVYKPIEEIVSHIGSTVDIVERLTTVYNFKATE